MAQKVATARKMKSRQETTSLGQIATVIAKLTIRDKHLQTLTRDILKFRQATWNPLAGPQCSINIIAVCEAFYIYIFQIPWLPENFSVSILKGTCKWPCLIRQRNSPPMWVAPGNLLLFSYWISVLQNSIS